MVYDGGISDTVRTAYEQYIEFSKGGDVSEAFLFFTDPHLLGAGNKFNQKLKNHFLASFDVAKELYDKIPLTFCLCGGDWLNSGDSQEMAKEKLLFADKQMKAMFSNYHKIMGNHDTNYLGIVSTYDTERGDLPREFIDKEYFSETGSAYYSFVGERTRFYVLDSGLDWNLAMDDYRWEQLEWLAKQLAETTDEHLALCIHMFYSGGKITPMSELLVDLCEAFNVRRVISLNGNTYDYSSRTGHIHFILAGHEHIDNLSFVGKDGNLPVVLTCNYTNGSYNSFDIGILDYNDNVLEMIRVGKGDGRRVKLNVGR